MTNDIQALENDFIDAMGNGASATEHLCALIETSIVSTDFRPISNVINALNRIGDVSGSRVVRSVFAAIFTGATVKKSKDKRNVVVSVAVDKSDAIVLDADALARMKEAASDRLSIRDALVKRVKGDVEKAPTDLPKAMSALLKRMEKEGFSKAAVIAAMQAA